MSTAFARRLTAVGAAAALMAGLGAASGAAWAQEARSYTLATATTGGTYYPVGVALATLTKVKLEPSTKVSMSAITSAGSGENVKLLREDQAQFAIMQGLYGKWAANGTGAVENEGPQEWLRSVTMLWQNVEHFGIRTDHVESGTIEDIANLEGRGFSIGKKNSGTEGSGREILSNLGVDVDAHFDVAYLGYGPSAESFVNGTIDGFNIPAGPPVGAVTQAFAGAGDDLTILDFTDEQMARANGEGELWTRFVIPAGTYPDQGQGHQHDRTTELSGRARGRGRGSGLSVDVHLSAHLAAFLDDEGGVLDGSFDASAIAHDQAALGDQGAFESAGDDGLFD